LNEEINIEACIDSVKWSDDIVVFDSLSSDGTKEIALQNGARVIERSFDNWASHQNWAIKNIYFQHPWVFYLDADERCPKELSEEISRIVSADNKYEAFRLKRRDYFMGKWLKHAQLYPTWLVRLFKPEKIRFERLVNPFPIVNGQIGELTHDLIHYPFSHGVSHWIDRHNKYSDMEAVENIKLLKNRGCGFSNLFSKDANIRRKAHKDTFYKLPGRPIIKFIYYYFLRMGFLDGKPGLTYSFLQAYYEYMIVLKRNELLRKEKGLLS